MRLDKLKDALGFLSDYEVIVKWPLSPTKTNIGMAKPDDHNDQITIIFGDGRISIVQYTVMPYRVNTIVDEKLSFDQLEYTKNHIEKHL